MASVPVVDISADPQAVGAELDEICRTAGFFQIIGHGIADEVAGQAWTMATRFFDLPLADKLSVARPTEDYPYGYIPMAGEALSQSMAGSAPPDLKEVFNIGPPVIRPPTTLTDPDEAPSTRRTCGLPRCPSSRSRGRPTTPPCATSATA